MPIPYLDVVTTQKINLKLWDNKLMKDNIIYNNKK